MGTILIQINLLIPIIGRDHALLRINYPMSDIDFIHYNISIFWKICPNYWQIKLYSWDHNQGSFILQFQYLGETIHSWVIGAKVLRFTVLMMTQFQFLGKHFKKAQILFSLQPIKRWKLPNKFCFHLVLFCAGFLSQQLGGLSKGQVLLVLYFLQCRQVESISKTFF